MKRLYLSILYVVMISVLVSGTILFSKSQANINNSAYSHKISPDSSGPQTRSFDERDSVNIQNERTARRQEKINVSNNAAKLDLKVYLTEDNYGLVTLKLDYKLGGRPVTGNIDAFQMKEIRNIFGFREKYRNGYDIKHMLLNEKMKRLYFAVEGKNEDRFYRTTLYSYDLENSHLEKIHYDVGVFKGFAITPDGKYNACWYSASQQNIPCNEEDNVIVFNCRDNKQIFDSSRDMARDKKYLISGLYVYSFDFVKWRDNHTFELSREIRAKDGAEKAIKKSLLFDLNSRKVIK
ncbi:hypothetical protein [Ruminiclostridium cellobioparum]|uniref:hypothetical protein n=1 Tax=Ruminiclostridium cellobioparum TaxID=29355 RepID=UPI0028B0B4CD|nr:hypothetical protein [Ruminiclostridium cellobioparum]